MHAVHKPYVNRDAAVNFVIGFLAPWNATFEDFSALTSASALAIAIEAIHADPTLGNRINLTYVKH